jgi:hypothetical protein
MRELELNYAGSVASLDRQIRAALGERLLGISTFGPDRPILIYLEDSVSAADVTWVMGLASAPQPIWPKLDANYQSKSPIKKEVQEWRSPMVKSFWRQIS